MPSLNLHTYSGMLNPLFEGDREDCRVATAQTIKHHRASGRDVIQHGNGRWELCESDEASMVSDDTGHLYLDTYEEEDNGDLESD